MEWFAHTVGPPLGLVMGVLLPGLAAFVALPLGVLFGARFMAEIAAPATALIEAVSAGAERLAQVFLLFLLAGTLLIVALRYIFGIGSNALAEGALFAHGLAFLLAAPAALARDAHVRVDVLSGRLSARGKAWIDFLAFYLFLAPMTLAILVTADQVVGLSWRIAERSPEGDGLPGWFLVKTAIPVFACLLLAQGVAWACRAACVIRGLDPAPARFAPDQERPA
jgi:TRAP-type mannitol/chloroaromatic compound transport system permease small subunit